MSNYLVDNVRPTRSFDEYKSILLKEGHRSNRTIADNHGVHTQTVSKWRSNTGLTSAYCRAKYKCVDSYNYNNQSLSSRVAELEKENRELKLVIVQINNLVANTR